MKRDTALLEPLLEVRCDDRNCVVVSTLAEFLEANADTPELCGEVKALAAGESVVTGGGAQPVVEVVRVGVEVVAYSQRMSCDMPTGSMGMLTKMWRVVPLPEYPEDEVVSRVGERWRSSYPRATAVVEMRYVRRGVDEGWKFHDLVEGEKPEEVWHKLDSPCVLLAPSLIALLSSAVRRDAEEAAARAAEAKAEAERAEVAERVRRSEAAFVRLMESADGVWAKRWNVAIRWALEPKHAELGAQLAGDARFRELHEAVHAAVTVPTKRGAIRRALQYMSELDSRLASVLIYMGEP